ncbi:hypothetical protein DWB85_03420 [Seongchinamella sediminis]|uniref:Uncharacterized protein n=1 Tax=Seongchinamella sediminis TaxID=2283635 RepID=A0A3L7E3Q9_9GAMM|nr:hypothetical protein [Seongchinamella sediminis]RLQ23041.1 hypothetical protein DWB85_03420 [Seongchinamella sediminis]
MTDDTTAPGEPNSAAAHSLLRTERHLVRLTFWQTILSVVGIVIAILALYAALTESAAVRQQTAAAVWPFVQLMVEDYDTGDAAGFSLAFTNAGVGPAKMQDVRVSIDGKVTRNWSEVVASVDGDANAAVKRNFISNRVLRADETVVMFSTNDADLARKLVAAVSKPRGVLTFCYCSIFNECWLADSRKELQAAELVEVCPDFGDDTYLN